MPKLVKIITPVMFGGLHLPFARTFSGASIPAPFYGANLSMAGGRLVITPTLETNLWTDSGLEGTYTDGLNTVLTKTGSPVVAQSADVHGGSKAQQFTATVQNDDIRRSVLTTVYKWYNASFWAKRTAGANGTCKGYFVSYYTMPLVDAAYTQKIIVCKATAASSTLRLALESGAAGFDTVIIDDVLINPVTFNTTLAAGVPASRSNVIVKARWILDYGRPGGVAACLDSYSNPQNGLFAWYRRYENKYTLEKMVNGAWTQLISASKTYVADAYIEIRKSGSSVSLYYNNEQVGTTQTVTDETIIGNKLHTLFSTHESNTCSSFSISVN